MNATMKDNGIAQQVNSILRVEKKYFINHHAQLLAHKHVCINGHA